MTTTTFHLSLSLGSESMRSGDDVQRALALVGAELANRFDGLDLPDYLGGAIRDRRGEKAGEWETTINGPQSLPDGVQWFISADTYAAVCEVVDRAKMDDRSLDADEYATEILNIMGVTVR